MYSITEETADEDLAKFWEGFVARLNEKTKWNLNARSTASIDQVLLKINAPKDTDPESHAQTKRIWRTSMKCVERLGVFVQSFGAFAAQAASVVFGPADQCFNAINFVITAAQQYKEIFNNITILMERISVFLERLGIFMANTEADVKLEKRLRRTVYRVLEHFLMVMSTTYELTNKSSEGKWERLKLMGKSFAFGEDGGIQNDLATLETLVSDCTGAQISVIVQDVSAAARGIRGLDKKIDVLGNASEKQTKYLEQLTAADAARTTEERDSKDRETLKKLLGIDESKSPWDRQNDIWNDNIPGTGQWLKEMPLFRKWADSKATAADVLILKAPSGFGKSHLASIVIQHLREKHRIDARVAVTYYYLQRESSEKTSTWNKILKTLIWQLARDHREYRKAAAAICELPQPAIDTIRTPQLWKRLITDLSKNVDMTVFAVVDGIDEADIENDQSDLIQMLRQVKTTMADDSSHLRVRLFIAGTKDALDGIHADKSVSVPEINLESSPADERPSFNQRDLELFVADRLNRSERLKGLDSQLKGRMTTELAEGARGAYSRLKYLLDDLVNIQNTNQIETILQRSSQSLRDIIAGKIETLNNTLSRDEIGEINTLLDWLLVSYEDLSILQCEAILSLKADGQSLGLEDRIRRKYSDVFSLNEAKQITLRPGVQDYLEESSAINTLNDQMPQSTQLQAPEVALVQKMLRTHLRNIFGDEDVYSRFAFDDFFHKKLGDQALRIRLIRRESQIKVAQGCMIVVCDKFNDPRSKELLTYAYNWFVEHLGLVKLDDVDLEVKQDLGRKLTRTLREKALIESWWATSRMYLGGWFVYSEYSEELLRSIHTWLKEPTVQKGLTDMPNELEWVKSVTAGETPSFALYSGSAKVMAIRWFEARKELEWGPAIDWLCGFRLSMEGKTQDEEDLIPVNLLREVQSWAEEQLGNTDQAGRWHARLAATFRRRRYHSESIEEYRRAIALLPTDWELKLELAEVLAINEEYAEARETVEKLIDQNMHLLETDEVFKEKYWGRLLHHSGEWSIKLEDFSRAENSYVKILQHVFEQQDLRESDRKAVVGMLTVLNKQSRYTEALDLLERLEDRQDTAGEGWLTSLFRECSLDDAFHNLLTALAKRSRSLDRVSQHYEAVIKLAPTQEDQFNELRRLTLRYRLAALLWTLGNIQQQEVALDLWEEIIHHDLDIGYASYVSYLRLYSTRYLAPALLSRCQTARSMEIKAPTDTVPYADRLQRLTRIDFGKDAQTAKDPRLTLARMYHKCGDDFRAKETVRDLVKLHLEEAEADTPNDGLYYTAVILASLDDNDNASSAWSHYTPLVSADAKSASSDDNDNTSDVDLASRTDAGEDVVSGAERGPTESDHMNESEDQVSNIILANVREVGNTTDEISKLSLKGALNNSCDGACGVSWTYADNIYACKDCLDIQLHEECYQKLKTGELGVAICRPEHDYIHIPPFDEAAWRARPKDVVIVGNQSVPRMEWIARMKKDWEIDEESLKPTQHAIQRIQRAWRAYRAFGPKRAGMIPA